jgi:hypothetical protein
MRMLAPDIPLLAETAKPLLAETAKPLLAGTVKPLLAGTVVVLLAGTAACGGRAAPEDLSSDPATLVLQVEELHSSPRPWVRGQLPRFSLYGGGRVIVPAGGSAALRSAREYRLSPDGYRDLVDRAYTARLDRPASSPTRLRPTRRCWSSR